MKTIELYNVSILDAVSLGKYARDFSESHGDYIKIEIFNDIGTRTKVVYSNRLLMKRVETGDYYLGQYHYNSADGFMEGIKHTEDTHSKLLPVPVENSIDEPLNNEAKYEKQFNIFKDKKDRIYIKPNDILKYIKVGKGKYNFKLHFLRNLKSPLTQLLKELKYNYVENGNFFAGLEATQTGDLDRSIGLNKFVNIENPGLGKFTLKQNGFGENNYNMKVTGVETDTYYIFSCWVGWDDNFDAGHSLFKFTNDEINLPVLNQMDELYQELLVLFGGADNLEGFDDEVMEYINTSGNPNQQAAEYRELRNSLLPAPNNFDADCGGTKLENGSRDLDSMEINGLKWHKRFLYFYVPSHESYQGYINIKIGMNDGENYLQSTHTNGIRYYTDLRVEKLRGTYDEHVNSLLGEGYPAEPTPDNNDVYQMGSGSMAGGY